MAYPTLPITGDIAVTCQSSSIGATPVAASVVVPKSGHIARTGCTVVSGTTTGSGTITVKITPAGGTIGADIGSLTVPIGSSGKSTTQEFGPMPTPALVEVGDLITFTPAGATGASVVGSMFAVIRKRG
jgi:hypothetical protein